MKLYQSGCLVCGQDLVYLAQNEPQTCVYCGQNFEASCRCLAGHYVCDTCHSLDSNEVIEQFCIQSDSTDPMAMAVTLMSHPALHMHGPEHHFLVPAVLLAAYYNQRQPEEKAAKIRQARKRAEKVLGGFCGFYGSCGAGVGAGIFISLVTNATPLSKLEWKLSNRMTAECLLTIAEHGGPRCCKRDTYLAVQTAQSFLKDHFDTSIGTDEPIRCRFSAFNKECLQQECPFFERI